MTKPPHRAILPRSDAAGMMKTLDVTPQMGRWIVLESGPRDEGRKFGAARVRLIFPLIEFAELG